ncbi:MAG: hemolysin family protein [Ignavibacteria bacterium]|nr:hemolysin family protein [Ignavibacteria bacterium]
MDNIESQFFQMFIVFALIISNGIFVAFEYALIRVRDSELASLIKKGNKKAVLVSSTKAKIEKYISATQLGITLVNLLLGWFGDEVMYSIFYPLYSLFGMHENITTTVTTVSGIALITFLTVVLGEFVPKVVAIRKTLPVSFWLARPIKLFYSIFKPFIFLLEKTGNYILKIINIEPTSKLEEVSSQEEIEYIIEEGVKSGVIDSTEHQLIQNIFEFNDKMVKDIMVPRNNIVAIEIDSPRDKIIETIIEQGYSRIPVYKETIDNIVGILYSKDLISAAEYRGLIVLQDILRTATFIPETKRIGETLKEFQKKRIQMGIVINEHGGVEGLVTLEDIIEEIVGEIEDEYDIESIKIQKDESGVYLVNPIIEIKEFNEYFNTEIPEQSDEYRTLSGFLQFITGKIPNLNDRIEYKDLIFIVNKKEGNKLLQLKVYKKS